MKTILLKNVHSWGIRVSWPEIYNNKIQRHILKGPVTRDSNVKRFRTPSRCKKLYIKTGYCYYYYYYYSILCLQQIFIIIIEFLTSLIWILSNFSNKPWSISKRQVQVARQPMWDAKLLFMATIAPCSILLTCSMLWCVTLTKFLTIKVEKDIHVHCAIESL